MREAFQYHQLEHILREKFNRTLLEPITLNRVLSDDEKNELEFRLFNVTGHFLHEREMIFYPKYHNKQLGFHLYTPFKITDGYDSIKIDCILFSDIIKPNYYHQ